MMVLKQGKDAVNFRYLLSMVYGPPPMAKSLIARMTGRELSKEVKRKIQGNFVQDFRRLLEMQEADPSNEEINDVVRAYEEIYLDATELYEITRQLEYSPPKKDGSDQEVLTQKRNVDDPDNEMVGLLRDVFMTSESRRSTQRYKSFYKRRDGRITYEDIQAGMAYSVRDEEFDKYFDGEYAFTDIYDHFVTEGFDEDHKKVREVNETAAVDFLNRLMKTAIIDRLSQEQGSVDMDDVESMLLSVKIDSLGDDINKDQRELIREGYLRFAIMRNGQEITTRKHARTVAAEREAAENIEKYREKQPIKIEFPEGFADSIIDTIRNADPERDLTPAQEAKIREKVLFGAGIGFFEVQDNGATKTTKVYDADNNLVDEYTEVTREAGTGDQFGVGKLALGANIPIDLGPGQQIFISVGGVLNLREVAESGVGAQVGYSAEAPNGIRGTISAGAGFNFRNPAAVGGSIRGNFSFPAGPLRFDLEAGVLLPIGAFEVGISAGANEEWIYKDNLKKEYEKKGYTEIEGMISNSEAVSAIAVAILEIPEFSMLKEQAAELQASLSGGTLDQDGLNRYILEVYKARRQEVAGHVLDSSRVPPMAPSKIGVKIIFVPNPLLTPPYVPIPIFHITIRIENIPLVFRTTGVEDYENLSDERILAQFDEDFAADPDLLEGSITEYEVAKMATGDRGEYEFVKDSYDPLAFSGFAQARLSGMNEKAHNIGIDFNMVEVAPETAPGRELLEMQVADVEGNLEFVIDPTLVDPETGEPLISLVYETGSDKDHPDRFFLAMAPDQQFCIKRQEFYYHFSKDGQFVKTVITITENPAVTRGQLVDLERAAILRKNKGFRSVEDAALARGYLEGDNNIMTLEEYLTSVTDGTAEARASMAEWSQAKAVDDMIMSHIEALGVIDLGGEMDPGVEEKLLGSAIDVMTDLKSELNSLPAGTPVLRKENGERIKTFREAFKYLSTTGNGFTSPPRQLIQLVQAKGEEIMGTPLDSHEFQFLIQTLNLYSMTDYASKPPEKQKEIYERMEKNFFRRKLTEMFTDLGHDNAEDMTDLVLRELTPDFSEGAPDAHEVTGTVFGSFAGTEDIEGLRISEDYRFRGEDREDFYRILSEVEFDIDSTDPMERDIARAIILTLNPLPEETEMVPANVEAVREFLTDDFTQRVSVAWYLLDPMEGVQLKTLIETTKFGNWREYLTEALEDPENQDLLTRFQQLVRDSRELEIMPKEEEDTKRRLRITDRYLAEDSERTIGEDDEFYISFEDVYTSFGVFERCGNVSMFLDEKMSIQNKQGQMLFYEDESHRMVATANASDSVSFALAVTAEKEIFEDHEDVEKHLEEGEKEPGTRVTPGQIETPDEIRIDRTQGHGEDVPT